MKEGVANIYTLEVNLWWKISLGQKIVIKLAISSNKEATLTVNPSRLVGITTIECCFALCIRHSYVDVECRLSENLPFRKSS